MLKPELLLNDLEQIDLSKSRYTYKGKGIPSVTELLSFVDNQGLIDWANMIGRKGINNQHVLQRAAQFGTNTHSAIENYLKGKDVFTDNSSFKAFLNWWKKLNDENKVEIIGQEEPLICQWYGGTLDLLLNINGDNYLFDFKTSNHISYKYILQLAAYRYMLKSIHNIDVAGVGIIKLNKQSVNFEELMLHCSDPNDLNLLIHAENCFHSLVYGYYERKYIEREFRLRLKNN